jgi:hypothetical protein
MMRNRRHLPAPATVLGGVALFAALGGTSLAAVPASGQHAGPSQSNAFTRQETHQIQQIVRKLSGSLHVDVARLADFANYAADAGYAKTAGTATSATTAVNATNAVNAKNATSATNATNAATATNALNLGGQPASAYQLAGKVFTSGGDQVVPADGQAHTLGSVGQFTFTATCTAVPAGSAEQTDPVDSTQVQHKLEFDVVDNSRVADLDGNQAVAAGTPQDVMTILDNSSNAGGVASGPVAPFAFNQTPSASSSTEIAARPGSTSAVDDVDVFYTIALNPFGGNAPECVAGYTGFES